jgi:hypothetical protein
MDAYLDIHPAFLVKHHHSHRMKHTLIVFDTDTLPGKVRHTLMGPEYGYVNVIKTTDEGIDLSLPVNALAHLGKSPEQATTDTKAVCQTLGIALRKCLVFEVAETNS